MFVVNLLTLFFFRCNFAGEIVSIKEERIHTKVFSMGKSVLKRVEVIGLRFLFFLCDDFSLSEVVRYGVFDFADSLLIFFKSFFVEFF